MEKMEGSCSTGQSPQWAVVPVEEEEEEEEYTNQLCLTYLHLPYLHKTQGDDAFEVVTVVYQLNTTLCYERSLPLFTLCVYRCLP
jgi:hypothetical protein